MRYAALALLVLLAAGATAPKLAAAPPARGTSDFSGSWETTFGSLTLKQDGARVTGSYNAGTGAALLEGTVEKNRLTFTYEEPGVKGEGWFELAGDGQSFTGKWRELGDKEWAEWQGKRATPRPPSFAGLWSTNYGRMRLVQDGKTIRGAYSGEGGSSVDGTLDGKKLTFRYKEPAAQGEGWFQLADDGKSFQGKWRAQGATDWQDWQGHLVEPRPGRLWLVVVEANWEGQLAEQEYSFGKMLRAFFERAPHVQVRHRIFNDEASLRKWCAEVAYLPEPVVLVVASHGSDQGVATEGKNVPVPAITDSLRFASNLKLLHFSSCDVLRGKDSPAGAEKLGKHSFPISGYTTTVDWAASAVIEFTYFDLILTRGLTPQAAAEQLRKLMPFVGDKDIPGAVVRSAGFRLLVPEARQGK